MNMSVMSRFEKKMKKLNRKLYIIYFEVGYGYAKAGIDKRTALRKFIKMYLSD